MSVITIKTDNISVNPDNFVYSKSGSRPSKSIVDPEKFTIFKNIKQAFAFLEDPDDVFGECILYFFRVMCKVDDSVYILDDATYKIINFTDNKFKMLTETLKDKYDNYVIKMKDIYTYPKIQYIYILSKYFVEINIILSQINPYVLVICSNKKMPFDLCIQDNFIKDFGIKVDETIIKQLKQDNNVFLDNVINLNTKVTDICKSLSDISNLNRETYTLNKYYKAYINKECNTYCNCKPNCIIYSNLFQCYICENCLTLSTLFLL